MLYIHAPVAVIAGTLARPAIRPGSAHDIWREEKTGLPDQAAGKRRPVEELPEEREDESRVAHRLAKTSNGTEKASGEKPEGIRHRPEQRER
jgi:hypothetical protein